MRLIILLAIVVFFSSQQSFANPVLPHFGLSGEYQGTIRYKGADYETVLQIVQHGNIVRGVLTADIEYTDVNGETWEKASLLVKGNASERKLYFSDYQCSAVVAFCDAFGDAKPDYESDFTYEKIGGGSDYSLFKINLANIRVSSQGSGRTSLPFETDTSFVMKSTFSDAPIHASTVLGSWGGFGYFPENYVVVAPVPFFLQWDLTLYKDHRGNLKLRSFRRTSSGWDLDQGINIVTFDEPKNSVDLSLGANNYHLQLHQGVLYGRVFHEIQRSDFFDFFGLFWLMPN